MAAKNTGILICAEKEPTLKVYGLTGGIASGKSLAARYFAEAGIPVVDADTEAKNLLQPGTEVFQLVVEAFGTGVLTDTGQIDRDRLAAIVFNDKQALSLLNGWVHPRVYGIISDRLKHLAAAGHRVAIVEAALLGENGMLPPGFDGLILVSAPEEIRLQRLIACRGMNADAARARIAAQTDPEAKRAISCAVLDNGGSPEQLRDQVMRIISSWNAKPEC